MASTRQKILILSLLILLIATNSFAAEPKPPETAAAELQQKKDKAVRMAKDLDQVKQILSEIDPEKIKPKDISVPQDYTKAKEKFETARDSIFTQIENLVGNERFDDPSKDVLGGYLKDLTDASTSAAVDSALKKVTDAVKIINEQIEEVKYYVTWILKSGLDEYKRKLTSAQRALGVEIEEASPGSQPAKMKLERIDETVVKLLTLPEKGTVSEENEIKAVKILKIMNKTKNKEIKQNISMIKAVGRLSEKKKLLNLLFEEYYTIFKEAKEIKGLIERIDEAKTGKELESILDNLKTFIENLSKIFDIDIQKNTETKIHDESSKAINARKFLKEICGILTANALKAKLVSLNQNLDNETWYMPWKTDGVFNLKKAFTEATTKNNLPSRQDMKKYAEKYKKDDSRKEEILKYWAEIVWDALGLPSEGLK